MDGIDIEQLKDRIARALSEDIGNGDLTVKGVTEFDPHAQAEIVAKQEGIIAGLNIAELVFSAMSPPLDIIQKVDDGDRVKHGDQLMVLSGSGRAILSAERTALNLLGRMSGIATMTRSYVDAVSGTNAKILDTRKTTPLWRDLEKYAVHLGGGVNHRMGLYDMVLIKENHIRWAGGIREALSNCLDYLRQNNSAAKVEIEVQTLDELREALDFNIDRVLLDNMSPEEVKEAVDIIDGTIKSEVSGGIGLNNILSYAETGVDFISVGALTHSVSAFDLSLLFLDELLEPGKLEE